jgi:hypothetical protein
MMQFILGFVVGVLTYFFCRIFTEQRIGGHMEKEYFTWESWDGDHNFMQFYGCELLRPMGDFADGSRFEFIIVNYEEGWIEFPGDFRYKATIKIGEKILKSPEEEK